MTNPTRFSPPLSPSSGITRTAKRVSAKPSLWKRAPSASIRRPRARNQAGSGNDGILRRIDQLGEVGRQDATWTAIQSGRVAPLQIFMHDSSPQLSLQLHALVEILYPAAHQDRHRLHRLGDAEGFEQDALCIVELLVNFLGDVGVGPQLSAQMHRAVADVA